jgi:muramoyltetrapeptide carboxypeptidase
MNSLPTLNPGDRVEIIAPASRSSDVALSSLIDLLKSWDLDCIVQTSIFGDDLLCANTDEQRYTMLIRALQRTDTQAVICLRGGYGSMRLIPLLSTLPCPPPLKLFLGMSDITALHSYFGRFWHWPTLFAGLNTSHFSKASLAAVKSLLFNGTHGLQYTGIPLNQHAKQQTCIESTITGGNLCLIQCGIGTIWEIDAQDKILFLEEVNERAYRIDRMLEHCRQANILNRVAAIVLGDFIGGNEPDGTDLTQPVLQRFADLSPVPVIQIKGIGHGHTNLPLVFGTRVKLHLGQTAALVF